MQGGPQTQLYGLHRKVLTHSFGQLVMHCANKVWQLEGAGHRGHQVVTPLHVTRPRSPAAQFRSMPEQLEELVLLLQLTEVLPQLTVAVQSAFATTPGRLAANSGAGVTSGAASVARNA